MDAGKWGWTAGGAAAEAPPEPKWNPRTGFMKTRAQVEAEQRAAEAAGGGSSISSISSSSSGSSGAATESTSAPTAAAATTTSSSGSQQPPAAGAQLPAVTRSQVLSSCAGTSAALAVIAAVIRAYADKSAAAALGTDPDLVQALLRLPAGFEHLPTDTGVMLAAAGAVTAVRLVLLEKWGALAEATNASNRQVLTPLNLADVALISLLTGASEELLFRGALIPASWPDWRGALLAAAVFGALHQNGGRNAAFAAWAGAVGALYGAAFLYTGNIWVAAGAHALANFSSAAVWKSRNGSSSGGGGAQ
jgi:membrane protease YdiL (CAAX protease family)